MESGGNEGREEGSAFMVLSDYYIFRLVAERDVVKPHRRAPLPMK